MVLCGDFGLGEMEEDGVCIVYIYVCVCEELTDDTLYLPRPIWLTHSSTHPPTVPPPLPPALLSSLAFSLHCAFRLCLWTDTGPAELEGRRAGAGAAGGGGLG